VKGKGWGARGSCSPCDTHAALSALHLWAAVACGSSIARTKAHEARLHVRTVSVRPWKKARVCPVSYVGAKARWRR